MISTRIVLFGFAVVSTSFLSGSFPHVGAQSAGEAATTSEPNLQEPAPSHEPAPEQPALQLKLDDAGVDVAPGLPRTIDGYTLEEVELRVRRARIGLLSTTGVTVVGAVLFGAGAVRAGSSQDLDALSEGPLLISGMSLMISGAVGMIASGIVLGLSKGELRRLKEARYDRPRRVQWDLARSRVVF
ncbi:MAG: hypothetical protein JRG93_10765 [Deltaproteobacteria bacterium]|nr:hypothetical protein [Deltaproteobacteria bacterium]MBW2379773.1 hypothetical protein [Deltaproteobacteria bacterium]